MDYYKVLNLKEDASLKQIEQAYLDLSSFYNPSNNVSKLAYKRYREINKAYLVLKEEKQRELYNLSLKEINKEEVNEKGIYHSYDEFIKNVKTDDNVLKFKDIVVDDEFSDYEVFKIEIPYLYYLLNSEYLFTFNKKEIISSSGICPSCLGIGKVKQDDKIVYCKECLSSGKNVVIKEVLTKKYYQIEDKVIDRDNKIIIEFYSNDKDEYILKGNTIIWNYKLNETEYLKGVNYHFKNNDNVLDIIENDFTILDKTYVFLDKFIKINYLVDDKYLNKVKEGYIVSDKRVVYLNPSDFSYSENSSDKYTFKLELNDKNVSFNIANREYLIHIIRLKNENDSFIFFDKKIRRVSANLFRFKGVYNNHNFKKKYFEYDDNYLYIPNRAYKLKSKYYSLFKVIYMFSIFIVPLILFLIFNVSYMFFILSFIYIVIHLIGVNLAMEVKV